MESDVIIVLLSISSDSNNYGTWNMNWSSLDVNTSLCGVGGLKNVLSKSHTEGAHIVSSEILTSDGNRCFLIERSVPWLDLLDLGIIVICEGVVWKRVGFSISGNRQTVVVVTSIRISKIKVWGVAVHGVVTDDSCVGAVGTVESASSLSETVVLTEVLSGNVDLGESFEWSTSWLD